MNAPETRDQLITVRVLKHDGTEYRRWHGQLVQQEHSLLVLEAEFDVEVSHHLLGAIKRGTRTVEYYWLDRWYNVLRFLENDGSTRLWYCNVNTPPLLDDDVLTYVDLDIDVLVMPDFSYQVLDLDEFDANAERYGYSNEEKAQARAAVEEMISLIKNREFPFRSKYSFASSMVKVV